MRVNAVEDCHLPLDDSEVSPRLESVLWRASEVRFTDFLVGTPPFSDEFLHAGRQGFQIGNRFSGKAVEMLVLFGREVQFFFEG